jgi:hypothetical protein
LVNALVAEAKTPLEDMKVPNGGAVAVAIAEEEDLHVGRFVGQAHGEPRDGVVDGLRSFFFENK